MNLPFRRLLLGLVLLTAVAAAQKVVSLSAPMPTAEAPSALHLNGFRVSALEGLPPRQGRELSHGTLRRFRLVPRSGEPPLTLTLLPVRSRTGTELSESSKERKGLNMVAVATEVPSFALNDKRFLSLPLAPAEGMGGKVDEIALGRGPGDAAGSTTRLQTCLTPSGVTGLSASTLVGESQRQGRPGDPPAWWRRALRFAGLSQARYECLAVQLEREAAAGGTAGGPDNQQRPLVGAWRDVRGVLVSP